VDNLANLLQGIFEKHQSNVTLPAGKAPFAVTNEYGFAHSHEVKTTNSIAYTNPT